MFSVCLFEKTPAASLGRDVGVTLHLIVDQLRGCVGLVQHTPAFQPISRSLQFLGGDRRRIRHHQAAFRQVRDLEERNVLLSPLAMQPASFLGPPWVSRMSGWIGTKVTVEVVLRELCKYASSGFYAKLNIRENPAR